MVDSGSAEAGPSSAPGRQKTFSALGLTPALVRSLASLRITHPTPIQDTSIPQILGGNDLIGGSPTGSGKTLAFALPILHRLVRDMVGGFAVILTPTRELALQLHEQFVAVGEGARMGLRVALVVGGLDIMRQAIELSKDRPHIIIATPGRLVDIMQSGGSTEWGLERCKFVVLDEADRLLTDTFGPELAYLFGALPPPRIRQTLLFSATLTPEIEALANKEPKEPGERKPILCKIEQSTATPATLLQRYLFVPSHIKEPYLYHLLLNAPVVALSSRDQGRNDSDSDSGDEAPQVPLTIIFVARSERAALLSHMLSELSVPNVALHSTLTQPQRLESLSRFRARSVPVLITTDLGSRGLDVPDVELVVNWDLPRDWRDYIHRVGRTARRGKRGVAVSFVGERDVGLFKGIEDTLDIKMDELAFHEDTVLEKLNPVMTAKRMASMHLHDTHFGERKKRNDAKAIMRNAGNGKPDRSSATTKRKHKDRLAGAGKNKRP